ncbi:MAG TPA: sigma factor-like helix-turn-helix DNA-binding protein [Acidimicrobiia bacterium]|nr:sigma factor-like helix-turn-helix DNA-binding protein [Acidimicrobiia bacterium]
MLSDIEGMSMPEVSEVLGVPVGTVKSRVFRGRRLMAQRLGVR